MHTGNTPIDPIIPHLFRQEYAKLTAVLSRYFGLQDIDIAEDIASETFLKAMENWPIHGIPDNPEAWLCTVAKNKAKDYLKRQEIFKGTVKAVVDSQELVTGQEFEFTEKIIADSQLSMIFAVCDPSNPPQVQICLALQILCGFSVDEIANAFLSNKETIKKRLQRGRDSLRASNFQLKQLSESEINGRFAIVLKSLYLLFNEGYFSRSKDVFIRKDLCSEAMRLTLLLVESKLADVRQASALLSLMCFQSSRLDARIDDTGEAILYDDQDRSLWDRFLIEKGNYYLFRAFETGAISCYHLQAGIAYWHTTAQEEKWPHILQLYNQLLALEYSPATAINRTFAFAKVHGNTAAIAEAKKFSLPDSSYYYGLLGYLYKEADTALAVSYYRQAVALSTSRAEKKALLKQIADLNTDRL